MLNINNKSWNELSFSDIEKILQDTDDDSIDENFFFEFKSDDEMPSKLMKEVSALSNTYGGYIFLGINDDKTVGGCTKWTEQRIHTTIHSSITPVPDFDVKRFETDDGKTVFVIRIEEGNRPPYITNKGKIFERVSSGSFPITDSSKLVQLYNKIELQKVRIRNQIEIPDIRVDEDTPSNIMGYVDMGFAAVCSEPTVLENDLFEIDLKPMADYIRSTNNAFSISKLSQSYLISIGEISNTDNKGKVVNLSSGINNFMEVMFDGSAKCRMMLIGNPDEPEVDISNISTMCDYFEKIYGYIFGESFSDIFVYASKYERLTVLKQFIPYNRYEDNFRDIKEHCRNYGNNLIITNDRYPKSDYAVIDKKTIEDYNTSNLIKCLFESMYRNLGYIDTSGNM